MRGPNHLSTSPTRRASQSGANLIRATIPHSVDSPSPFSAAGASQAPVALSSPPESQPQDESQDPLSLPIPSGDAWLVDSQSQTVVHSGSSRQRLFVHSMRVDIRLRAAAKDLRQLREVNRKLRVGFNNTRHKLSSMTGQVNTFVAEMVNAKARASRLTAQLSSMCDASKTSAPVAVLDNVTAAQYEDVQRRLHSAQAALRLAEAAEQVQAKEIKSLKLALGAANRSAESTSDAPRLRRLVAHYKRVTSALKSERDELVAAKIDLREQVESLVEDGHRFDEEREELEGRVEEVETGYEELEDKLRWAELEASTAESSASRRIKGLEAEIADLKAAVRRQTREIKALKAIEVQSPGVDRIGSGPGPVPGSTGGSSSGPSQRVVASLKAEVLRLQTRIVELESMDLVPARGDSDARSAAASPGSGSVSDDGLASQAVSDILFATARRCQGQSVADSAPADVRVNEAASTSSIDGDDVAHAFPSHEDSLLHLDDSLARGLIDNWGEIWQENSVLAPEARLDRHANVDLAVPALGTSPVVPPSVPGGAPGQGEAPTLPSGLAVVAQAACGPHLSPSTSAPPPLPPATSGTNVLPFKWWNALVLPSVVGPWPIPFLLDPTPVTAYERARRRASQLVRDYNGHDVFDGFACLLDTVLEKYAPSADPRPFMALINEICIDAIGILEVVDDRDAEIRALRKERQALKDALQAHIAQADLLSENLANSRSLVDDGDSALGDGGSQNSEPPATQESLQDGSYMYHQLYVAPSVRVQWPMPAPSGGFRIAHYRPIFR